MSFELISLAMPQDSEKSVQILSQILGGVVDQMAAGAVAPSGQPTLTMFGQMMHTFNILLLGFGTLIFGIMLFVGVMNSAADGQFLGKNWHSIWTPLRLILGLLFVVPLNSGYCVGQYIFLYLIMLGIQLGTYLWNQVVEDIFMGYSPPAIPLYVKQAAINMMENQIILISLADFQATIGSQGTLSLPVDNTYNAVANVPSYVKAQMSSDVTQECEHASMLFKDPIPQNDCKNIVAEYFGDQIPDQTKLTAGSSISMLVELSPNFSGNYYYGGTGDIPASGYMVTPYSGVHVFGTIFYNLPTKSQDPQSQFLSPAEAPGDVPGKTPMQDAFNTASAQFSAALNPDPTKPVAGAAAMSLKTSPKAQGYPSLAAFVTAMVNDPNSSLTTNKCQTQQQVGSNGPLIYVSNGNCNITGFADGLVAAAQAALAKNVYPIQAQNAGGGVYYDCTNYKPSIPATPTSPAVPEVPCIQKSSSLNYYIVNGIPVYDKDGNPEQRPAPGTAQNPNNLLPGQIAVPLYGSWWNAGESYLIIANQFASNLKLLMKMLQQNVVTMDPSGDTINGTVNLTYTIFMAEISNAIATSTSPLKAGFFAMNTTGPADTWFFIGADPNSNGQGGQNAYWSRYADQERALIRNHSEPLPLSLAATDLGVGNWADLAALYSPNPLDENGNALPLPAPFSTDVAQKAALAVFYGRLQKVPLQYQLPLAMLLNVATTQPAPGVTLTCTPGTTLAPGSCLVALMPYLSNLLNILDDNNLLSSATDNQLPLNSSLNQMFSSLLGNAGSGGKFQPGSNTSVASVMQDIYNLGATSGGGSGDGNLFADQFSMIQQTQNVGISVLAACVGAMQQVYDNYSAILNRLQNKVNQDVASAESKDWIGAVGGLPIVGPVMKGVGDAAQANAQLALMQTTVVTMSNIGMQLMWMPLFLFVVTTLITIGVQFTLLIPMMPYIMFWAGGIAWVLGVLEAMVAAPLVMLAVAHPGGHDYMGHSQPAVRMLIGIVFRPVLMVIGMITGILLTFVLLSYSADGFHIVAATALGALPPSNQTLMGIMSCLLVFVYASFLVMAFQKCFSPIYLIPEKVVEWIGGSAAHAGEQEAGQFASNVQQTADKGASAGGQALQQGIQAQESKGQKMSDLGAKSAQTKYENISGIAAGAGQSATQAAELAMGGE